jgi:hypothetical protein
MDVARQTELTTDALQAHHDIMMGHMANIQTAIGGGAVGEGITRSLETPEATEQRERDELVGVPESARTPVTPRGLTQGSRERQQYIQQLMRGVNKDFILKPEEGQEVEPGTRVINPDTGEMHTIVRRDSQEGTQVAGDVVPIQRKEPIQPWNVDKPAGYQAETPEQAGAVAKGVMSGKVHVLTPGDKRSELELTRLAMEGPQSDKPVTYSVSGKLGEHVSGPVDATDLHHALKILQIMNMFSGSVDTTLKGEQK